MALIPGIHDDIGLDCLVRVPHQSFSAVAAVCRSWKREVNLPEFWRRRRASGLTRKVVVVAQTRFDPVQNLEPEKTGSRPVHRLAVCEPGTGYWAELPPIPGLSDGLPMFCQVVSVGLNVVVVGGWDPATGEVLSGVFVYNFIAAAWRRGAAVPGPPRSFFACASDGDRMVYVAGGHDGDKCALRSAAAYDVAADGWTVMPDMSTARDEARGVFRGGRFYVIGGYETGMQGRFQASAEPFDVDTWQWAPVEEGFLDVATCPRNCVGDEDGQLYMCSGVDVMYQQGSTWRAVAELPEEICKTVSFVTAWRGKLLVFGSEKFGPPYKGMVLDLVRGKWEKVEENEEFLGYVQTGCCLEL